MCWFLCMLVTMINALVLSYTRFVLPIVWIFVSIYIHVYIIRSSILFLAVLWNIWYTYLKSLVRSSDYQTTTLSSFFRPGCLQTSGQLFCLWSYHGERKTFFRKHVSCSLLSFLLINFQAYQAEYLSSSILLENTFCEYANISLPFP